MVKGSRDNTVEGTRGVYAARHAKRGRPAKDSRLIVGLLAIKHMTELSDEEVLESVRESLPAGILWV